MEPTLNGYYTMGDKAGQLVKPAPISISGIQSPETPLKAPPTIPPVDYNPAISSSLDSLLASYNAPTQADANQGTLQSEILKSLGTLGTQSERKNQLEQQAGLPEQRKNLQETINQLQGLQKEAQAIPLQIQQEFGGRGATAAGVSPIQTGRLRENAIKSLSLAAIGQTLQGNVALAESSIQKALDAEFEPEKTRLATLQQLYTFNKDALERTDKKKADTLNAYITERNRVLDLQKADKQEIYNIGLTAAKYGADPATVQNVYNAKSREDAVAAAGKFLQDPKAQIDLQNAKLDTLLKKAQIDKVNRETSLLGEPSAKDKKDAADALKEAKASIPVMQDKIAAVDVLKNAPGMASRVGTSIYSRAPQGFFGTLTKGITTLGIGTLQDASASVTGQGQDFAGGVHKLVGGLTLDNLIAAKARGATFGALSEGELNILANSASTLNDWEIKDKDGKGTGYWNIDEDSFNKELDNIKRLTQRAITLSGGSLYDPSEEAVFNALGSTSDTITSGASYY